MWAGSGVDIERQLGNTRVCVNGGEGAGLVAASSQLRQGAELGWSPLPPAGAVSAEAIHDFGDVILRVGEGRRGRSRKAPPLPYKCCFPGSLWDPELGGEQRAFSALPTPLAARLSPEGGPALAQYRLSAACCSPLRPCQSHSGRSDRFLFCFVFFFLITRAWVSLP